MYLSFLDHILSYVQNITLFVLVNKSIETCFTGLLNDIWRVYLSLKKVWLDYFSLSLCFLCKHHFVKKQKWNLVMWINSMQYCIMIHYISILWYVSQIPNCNVGLHTYQVERCHNAHVTPEAWGLRPWVNMLQLTCIMSSPLVSTKQFKPEILQFTNPTVFIGKLVRIDCEF